ncbi:hypothetical protein [Clostridium lundense]|uniref:hypothetical protein n=1 Tax=Clostridium lundense TaxID=319475 RepID=UPI000486C3AD|nr:hypothetical protein [Clostridium lundense]
MCRGFKIVFTMLIIFIIGAFNCKAQDKIIKINDLIEGNTKYSGKVVTIEGEAVGERMKRGNYSWININDGSNSIGLWLKNSDADNIKRFGNYKNKGDIAKVTGTFSINCKEHGGDIDIHVNNVDVIEKGKKVNHNLNVTKEKLSIILVSLTLSIVMFYYKRRTLRN